MNYNTGALTPRTVPGTMDTSLTSPPVITTISGTTQVQYIEKITAVSNYSYEQTQNEERKVIRLLDAKYISQIEQEFAKLMTNG